MGETIATLFSAKLFPRAMVKSAIRDPAIIAYIIPIFEFVKVFALRMGITRAMGRRAETAFIIAATRFVLALRDAAAPNIIPTV